MSQSHRESFKIRRYRHGDQDDVWSLHNVALEQVDANVGDGVWDDDLHHISDVYLDGSGEFLVGLWGDRIVAMGALKATGVGTAEIKRMRVHPDFQRRGLGQRLLEALETRARGLGCTTLRLETTVGQLAAQRLYEKNGYVEVGRTKYDRFDVIVYRKHLSGGTEQKHGGDP